MKTITLYAKQHRKAPTRAEKELRRKLLNWRITFRSQRQFDHYIVDFLIPERRLVIEVDGEYHLNTADYDNKRTEHLNSLGLTVIRVFNDQVLNTNCEELRKQILIYPICNIRQLPLRQSYGKALY